ncbi:MAG: twin-arginine translocase subunit TatC [Thermodesulfobacteriota bacterium]|nr:twin-arginine translocase subunit TatC [Thermodesulfobacteriota bacterium]
MEHYNNLIIFLSELRKSIRFLGISLLVLTVAVFFMSTGLITVFQEHLREKLYFFSVAGPFLAHVKVAFFGAVYTLMPLIMYVLWKAMGKPFGVTGKRLFWFVFATCFLFYAGTFFCYLVTLPFGVKFLLGFQSENMKAVISIGRFVNFVTIFILAFGVIFELPVFMIFSAQVGMISRRTFEKNRRFAVLGIAILAALLTPTPDVVNMALMGGPLYLLYEAGILVIRILQIDEKRARDRAEREAAGEESDLQKDVPVKD